MIPRTLAPSSNGTPTTTLRFGRFCLFGFRFWFSISQPYQYGSRMALVRILVDGYSLLHNWPELAPGQPRHSAAALSTPEVEVLYSREGHTADDMIERATHRFGAYGEVLTVTDDQAERETVISLGGMASSCWNFIQTVENTLAELAEDIKHHNRQERHRFQR